MSEQAISTRPQETSRGFTLVELLVVIAIIGVLMGLSIPAMQNMRELSRRSNCAQNLVRVSLALSAYAARNGHYPAGTLADSGPISSAPRGYHHNWIAGLLPMLDAANVYEAIDQRVSVYDAANDRVRSLRIPTLLCPSASDVRENTTCYAGIHASTETTIDEDNDGVFRLNIPVSNHDITDGLSYTLFVGEKLSRFEEDLGWISGTRSSLRNTGHRINAERVRIRGIQDASKAVTPAYVGGLASDHPGGAYLLLGSGEYQFRSSTMDQEVLRQLASRADGELPIEWKSTIPIEVSDGAGKGPDAER
jgi:prepilin-type N-terminal cleavage/methylation domain-containing protein